MPLLVPIYRKIPHKTQIKINLTTKVDSDKYRNLQKQDY